jgi:hypothetical protein
MLVGIELIVNGATWSVLAVAHRRRIPWATIKTRRDVTDQPDAGP